MSGRLDLVGLVVEDIEASLAFYRLLGLEIPETADDAGHGHVEITLPGGLRLAWDSEESVRSFDPGREAPAGGPRMALAFLLDSPAQVDAAYEQVVAHGYEGYKEPWDAFWGQRYAMVRDPDGNGVDLFAWLEG